VPNATGVVSQGQHLYDPARAPAAAGSGEQGIKVLTSLAFFRGTRRVYETPLVEATELAAGDRKAAVFQLDVPVSSLQPGLYTCQVTIVDDVAGTFAFPRLTLYVAK
jgi:hypothetical protein